MLSMKTAQVHLIIWTTLDEFNSTCEMCDKLTYAVKLVFSIKMAIFEIHVFVFDYIGIY